MLELNNVNSGYGKKTVLENISFACKKPQLIAIIGPNGSGKSTLIKTIDCLIKPSSGTITLDGENLINLSSKERAKRISYLPQEKTIHNITVEKLVLQGRYPYLKFPHNYSSEDYAAVDKTLEQLSAVEISGKLMSELSGGWRQIAYIAMALVQDTDYILLDEPLASLDIAHRIEVMNLLYSIRFLGKTIITVIHDISLALRFADRIIVMDKGRIVGDDDPENVYMQGIVDRVFGTKLIRFELEDSIRYLCE